MLTQAELKSHLHYNPETGIFTRIKLCKGTKVGDIAGGKRTDGYVDIRVNGRKYKAHRLAWLYVNDEFPTNQIDHVSGIKDDNRIVNLREATNQQNNFNTGAYKNNMSGFKGVAFNKARNKWLAKARLNGKVHHLGLFTTPKLASQSYQSFAALHHGEFYHG